MDVEVRIGAGAAKTVVRTIRAGRTVEKIMIVINVRGCFGSRIWEDGYAKVSFRLLYSMYGKWQNQDVGCLSRKMRMSLYTAKAMLLEDSTRLLPRLQMDWFILGIWYVKPTNMTRNDDRTQEELPRLNKTLRKTHLRFLLFHTPSAVSTDARVRTFL
jgi:hypothetical protein